MLYYAKIHEHYYTSIARNTETGLNIPLIPFYTNANFILLKHNNITYVYGKDISDLLCKIFNNI